MPGPIQSALSGAITTVAGGVAIAKKLYSKDSEKAAATLSSKLSDKKPSLDPKSNESGVDAKMAAKARRIAQQKISAIAANKEISAKARSRRIGQAINEYKKTIGGDK